MERARVNEIDLLRFLAALLVVLFHYSFRGYSADGLSPMPYPLLAPAMKYGYLGVELFFMISGFVILMTAASGSLRTFIVSRVARLYPAFWICCTATFIAVITLGQGRYSASLGQYLVNMTMLGGFVGVAPIDGVYWSLFIELQFYAFVAVIIALGQIHRAQSFLVVWLLATAVLEFFPVTTLRTLLIANYSAYFIGGATLYLVWSRGLSWARAGIILVAWILAVIECLGGIPEFERHFNTTVNPIVMTAIVTSFFAVMLLVSLRLTGSIGLRRWLVVGAMTYPLYLLHQTIGFIIFSRVHPAINTHLLLWGTVLLMLVIAYLVHVFVERTLSAPLKRGTHALITHFARFVRRPVSS